MELLGGGSVINGAKPSSLIVTVPNIERNISKKIQLFWF